jgi:hypothetical protein
MKKLNLKKLSFILIPVLLVIPCIMIVKSVSSSSSRVVLKDQLKIDKIILHDAKGDHACHCFSPIISGWQIKNITDVSASFRWVCSKASTYQVDYGTSSSKGTKYPATRPSATYTDYTVTVTGLKPNTKYYAGPRSHDPSYSGDGGGTGGDKLWLGSTDRNSGTANAFTTLASVVTTYSIQGSILDNNGAGISGVTVKLSGDSAATVTTPSAGTYSFANLKSGKNYTITPTKTSFTYSPANKAFSALAADQTQNFVQVTTGVMRDYSDQPLIYNITTSKITTRDAAITWKTNVPATSQVEYGTTRNFGLLTGENTELTTDHYIQLFDLTPGATYYFRAISKTGLGKASSSSSEVTSLTTRSIENRIANKASCFTEPNPCSDRVEFHYDLYQQVNDLTIDILTLSGKKVAVLQAPLSALVMGEGNRIAWNVKDGSGAPLINGLYVYVMKFKKGGTEEVLERSQFMVRR